MLKSSKTKSLALLFAMIFVMMLAVCFSLTANAQSNENIIVGIDQNQQAQQPLSASDGTFTYEHGKMTISVEGTSFVGSAKSVEVAKPANVVVTLVPDEGYVVNRLMSSGEDLSPLVGEGTTKFYSDSSALVDYYFEPDFVADQPGPGPEPVPVVEKGHVKITTSNNEQGTISYAIGSSSPVIIAGGQTIDITPEKMAGATKVTFKATPNASNLIDKESTVFSDGTQYVDVDYAKLKAGTYDLAYNPESEKGQSANIAFTQARTIKVNLSEASSKMLTEKTVMFAGYGDKNDVKIESISTSNEVKVTKNTSEKLLLSFAIKSDNFFIPYLTINNIKYPTFDTGMKYYEEGYEYVIIGCELRDSAAAPSTFDVDLSAYAEATSVVESEHVDADNFKASYDLIKEGQAVVGVDGEVELSVADAQKDPAVNGALMTFDLALTQDEAKVTEFAEEINIAMPLNKGELSGDNYKVVRDHDGQLDVLETECKVIRDPQTQEEKGTEISFASSKYSEYSIVPGDWKPADKPADQPSAESSKTGDTNPLASLIAIAGIASALGMVAFKKKSLD